MSQPKVSIVIPVYNGSNFMREAINSALAQDYANVEVIVVNDGSTDDTDAIAKSYGDRIRYFAKENGGVATALNLAIENAHGEYISWLSHDDVYYPNKISRQIEELEKLENKNVIVFSNFDVLTQETRKLKKNCAAIGELRDELLYRVNMLRVFFASQLSGCSLLIPKKLFDDDSRFDETQKTVQDYALWMKFYKSGVRFHYVDEALIVSRHHKKQDTLTLYDTHLDELVGLYRWAFDLFVEDFHQMPFWLFNEFLDIIKSRGLDKVYTHMLSGWSNGDWNKDKPVIWMYWENKKGTTTPDSIRLSWKTIVLHNKQDFQIKILTEIDVEQYLPAINKNYVRYKQIAHRADYIRFNLLYEYGGIWLDSDTIAFKSLADIKKILETCGFVCNGYQRKNGSMFTLIGFLGAKPHQEICKRVVDFMDSSIEKITDDTHEEWDHVGYYLSSLINPAEHYVMPVSFFTPHPVHKKEIQFMLSIPARQVIAETNPMAYAQALAYSRCPAEFNRLSEATILSSNSLIGDMFRLAFCPVHFKSHNKKSLHDVIYKRPSFVNNKLWQFTYWAFIRPILKLVYGREKVKAVFDVKWR